MIENLTGAAAALALLLAMLGAVYMLRRASNKEGRAEGKLETQEILIEQTNEVNKEIQEDNEEKLKQVEEAHQIHDRLESDLDYRKRVRERFTRED